MSTVAIIPARGGSTRIPKKNIIDFCGKPLITWTIEAAQESDIFDDIWVSTDDYEIWDIAGYAGAKVLMRSGYSDNYTTVQEATIRSLEEIKGNYDDVVLLMACCPNRTYYDIQYAYKEFQAKNSDYQISVCEYDFLNPWWAVKLKKDKPVPLFPKEIKMRSQDLPKLYCPVGAVWIAKIFDLKVYRTFYGPGYDIYPIDFAHAIDIDNYSDIEIAKRYRGME